MLFFSKLCPFFRQNVNVCAVARNCFFFYSINFLKDWITNYVQMYNLLFFRINSCVYICLSKLQINQILSVNFIFKYIIKSQFIWFKNIPFRSRSEINCSIIMTVLCFLFQGKCVHRVSSMRDCYIQHLQIQHSWP